MVSFDCPSLRALRKECEVAVLFSERLKPGVDNQLTRHLIKGLLAIWIAVPRGCQRGKCAVRTMIGLATARRSTPEIWAGTGKALAFLLTEPQFIPFRQEYPRSQLVH
jgi:hypothetical protein